MVVLPSESGVAVRLLMLLTPRAFFEVSGRVVQRDRPERIHGNIVQAETVFPDRETFVEVDVGGLVLGKATPAGCGTEQGVRSDRLPQRYRMNGRTW